MTLHEQQDRAARAADVRSDVADVAVLLHAAASMQSDVHASPRRAASRATRSRAKRTETIDWAHGDDRHRALASQERRRQDRDAYVWLAPSLRYVPVKMRVIANTDARHGRGGARLDSRRRALAGDRRRAHESRGAGRDAPASAEDTPMPAAPPTLRTMTANERAREPDRGARRGDRARCARSTMPADSLLHDSSASTRRWASTTARSSPTACSPTCAGGARSKRSRETDASAQARARGRWCASSATRCANSRPRRSRADDASWLRAFKSRLRTPLAAGGRRRPSRTGCGSGSAPCTATPTRKALAHAWLVAGAVRPARQSAEDDARRSAARRSPRRASTPQPTPYSPLGLRVAGRPSLARASAGSSTARSKCRTKAASSSATSSRRSAATWSSTSARAPAARRCCSAR